MFALLALAVSCAGNPDGADAGRDDGMTYSQAENTLVAGEPAQAPEGSWKGSLAVLGQKLDINLYFLYDEEGWSGRMDIPQQNARGLRLSELSWVQGSLRAVLPGPVPLKMEANIEGDVMSGRFTQGAASGTIRLERSGDAASLRQLWAAEALAARVADDPTVVSREVSLPTGDGHLFATLSVPAAGSTLDRGQPAVIIIPGSGPTDRDGNSILLPGKNNSLLMLGNALTKAGYPTLRIDKRGIGKSVWPGLREEDMTVDQMAEDIVAWSRFLIRETGSPAVVLAGHSEGGLVALLAASLAEGQQVAVDRLILLTPLAADFFDTIFKQLATTPEEYQQRARAIYEELKAGRDVANVQADQLALFRPSVQPYLRSLIRHQPAGLLAARPQPVLLVSGGRDLQIEVGDVDALATAGRRLTRLHLPSMNHVLKDVSPELADNQAAYSDPARPLAAGLADAIVRFLREE